MSSGYLAVSHPAWCEHIQATRPHRCAFWRRDTKKFRAIKPGDPFFFLKKQLRSRPLDDRSVIGYAEFALSETRPLKDLDGYYGLHELGVSSLTELEDRLKEIAWSGSQGHPSRVGVIQLGRLHGFRHPVGWAALPAIGIRFPANVVQGIGLSDSQVEALLDAGMYGQRQIS